MNNLNERLLKALETRKRVTQNLLDILAEIEDSLLEIIPDDMIKLGFNFEYKGICIRSWAGKQWGDTFLAINKKQLPRKVEHLGQNYYYMNDFNHYIKRADAKEVIELANNLYDYVVYLIEQIESEVKELSEINTEKLQQCVIKINKIVNQ